MWTSTNFTTYKKQFDFTSSEQGKPTFTALKIDDKDFINMVEGLEGEIDNNQISTPAVVRVFTNHLSCNLKQVREDTNHGENINSV